MTLSDMVSEVTLTYATINPTFTTVHPWCGGQSTSINACEV